MASSSKQIKGIHVGFLLDTLMQLYPISLVIGLSCCKPVS